MNTRKVNDGDSTAEPKLFPRVLVCGGRDYSNYDIVKEALDMLKLFVGVSCLIQGGADGADTLGLAWAREQHVDGIEFPAEWAKHGKAAGPLRNQRMLAEGKPDIVVAFPGGRGTADMVGRAKKANVVVWEVDENSHIVDQVVKALAQLNPSSVGAS